jgi:hypothetical protein
MGHRAATAILLVLACAGCTGAPAPEEVAATAPPAPVERPYIDWDVATERGRSAGQSATGAGEHLWSVAPEPGTIFGVTFALDELVALRFEAPRHAVPGAVPLDGAGWLWSIGCASWSGEARIASVQPHWDLEIDASCVGDPTHWIYARLDGWSE